MSKNPLSEKPVQRVFAYCRVSTEEQACRENNSLGMQRSFCEQYINLNEIHGWKMMRVIEDSGFSAGTLKRPGMEELIEAIEAGQVDLILIYKLDRLTRSIKDFYVLWEIMERHGVNFVSATESIDTSTPIGRVILHVILIFAQFEREQTAQRLKDKAAQAARAGERHPGLPPFGYDADSKNRSLVINAENAKIIRLMFQLAIELPGAAAVARELNKRGYRTGTLVRHKGKPTEHTVGGKLWNPNKVTKHVRNVAYKAIRLGSDGTEYPANWKPIVSKKIWEQANRAICKAERKETKEVAKRENFTNKAEALLKGILFCGHCGLSMSPKAGGKKTADGDTRPYYTCQSVVQYGAASDCQLRNIAATGFDTFIVRLIGEFGKNPTLIKKTVQASQKNRGKSVRPLKSKLAKLKAEFREVTGEINRCLKLARSKDSGSFTNELMTEANSLSERKRTLQREIDSLKAEIDYLQQSASDENLIAEAFCHFEQACQHLSFEERAEVIRLLLQAIKIKRIDPSPDELECFNLGSDIPESVQWYRMNLRFHIKEALPSTGSDSPGTQNKAMTARTEVNVTAGLVGSDWATGGFVVHPFKLDERRLQALHRKVRFSVFKKRHTLATALKWRSLLDANPHLGTEDIANQVGLSGNRVRQILRLLKLHPIIQTVILDTSFKISKRTFSERSLREFVIMTPEEQLNRFRQKWPDHGLPGD